MLPDLLAGAAVAGALLFTYRCGVRSGYSLHYRLRHEWARSVHLSRLSAAQMRALTREGKPVCLRHGPVPVLTERCNCRHAVVNRHPSGHGRQ